MTLPLDTHLENSRSHYYEDRFPIFLFTVYIDPIFIAIVPRFQETLATLAGKCHADCLSFFGQMEHCIYFSSNHNTAQCSVLSRRQYVVAPQMTLAHEFLLSQIKTVSAKTKRKTIKGWPHFATGRIRNSDQGRGAGGWWGWSGDRGSNIWI